MKLVLVKINPDLCRASTDVFSSNFESFKTVNHFFNFV